MIRITEEGFKGQVTYLAEILGWQWVHWRPLRTKHGWQTPYDGPLGKGWPDLQLIHKKSHRTIYAELKTEHGEVKPEQEAMLDWLSQALVFPGSLVYVGLWRPKDMDNSYIHRVLAGQEGWM
jgi:hypothetical protein